MTAAKSQMKLAKVVFTGPDDETLSSGNFPRLTEVAQQYPHVEFGVLISRDEFGKPRYPTVETLAKLCDFRDAEAKKEGKARVHIDLSCHVCNDWARELATQGSTEVFDKMGDVLARIPRIQLNFSRWQKDLNRQKLFAALKGRTQEFVFQLPSFENYDLVLEARKAGINAFAFFDPSVGLGISPKSGWPHPPRMDVMVGFAGGLGPHNIKQALLDMQALVPWTVAPSVAAAAAADAKHEEKRTVTAAALGEAAGKVAAAAASADSGKEAAAHVQSYWIDMETNVRTKECFDIDKCLEVLKVAETFRTS